MINSFFWTLIIVSIVVLPARAQKVVMLYPEGVPNSIPGTEAEFEKGEDKAVFNVTNPTLTAYLPLKHRASGTAVIICPGGGYGSLVIDREGHDVAKKLVQKGIAAFVLKYRLPSSKTMLNQAIGPLQDAQQSIKLIRSHAKEYGVDSNKIGIMGFSAGGHLASSAGVYFSPAVIENKENINLRPDFMLLIYPVITMDTLAGHKGSTFNLLGVSPDSKKMEDFSNELHVTSETPPTFLTVAGNDDLLGNSIMFYNALHKVRVQAELHIYSSGGHGYLKYPSFRDWTTPLFNWMRLNKWIN